MTFDTNEHIWGATSTNLERPTNAEIAAGHVKKTVAMSKWVNWHCNQTDNDIELAKNAAQAASIMYPSPNDKAIMSGQLMYSKEYSTHDPDGDLCRVGMTPELCTCVTPGWNHSTNKGCVYWSDGSTGEIYRTNSWDVGELTIDILDLDLTYVGVVSAMVCDAEYIYIGYRNTNTATFHIAQLSLVSWTGLAVSDQDTGWAWVTNTRPLTLALARPGVVGAYYNPADIGTFGVWKVGTSWTTGAGNSASVPGSYDGSNGFPELQATYDSLFTVVRSNNGGTYGYYLINCDVDAPSTASEGPAAPNLIWDPSGAVYGSNMSFRAFSDKVVFINPESTVSDEVFVLFNDGSANWDLRGLGDMPKARSTYAHSGRFCLDGNGRLWYQYRLNDSGTSERVQLAAVAWDPWVFHYDYDGSFPSPKVTVPMSSTDTAITSEQWLVSDGRNLVSVEKLASSATIFRVITTPGLR